MKRWLAVVAVATGLLVAPSARAAEIPPATLIVEPSTAAPGDTVTVTGVFHLPVCQEPLGEIVVRIAGGPELASVTAFDGLTTFRTNAAIPADTPPATVRVESRCLVLPDPGIDVHLASAPLEITATEPPLAPETEPPGEDGPPGDAPDSTEEPRADAGRTAPPQPVPTPTPTVATSPPPTPAPVSTMPAPDLAAAGPSPPAVGPSPTPDSADDPASETAAPPAPPHRSFTNLARFDNLGLDAERAGAGGLIVLLFALLVGFPATIFDATLRRHYDRITRRFERSAPRLTAARDRIASMPRMVPLGGFVAAAAIAGVFLEDGIGWNRHTGVTFVALTIALAATAYLGWLPAVIVADRKDVPGRFRSYPMALYLVAGGVLLSLAVDINPGYLYGLLFAYDVNGSWTTDDDGLTYGWGFAILLGVSITGWLAWMPVHDAVTGGNPHLALEIADVALAVIVVAGIEGTILGLLPFPFTPGATVRRWRPRVWAGLYAVGFLAFTQILLRPDLGYTESQDLRSLLTSLAAFGAFAGGSIWFWWYCNYRRPPPDTPVPLDAFAADDQPERVH